MRILPAKSQGCPQDPHPRLHQQAADLPAEQVLVPSLPPEPCPQSLSTGTAISLKTTVSAYGLIESDCRVFKCGSMLMATGGLLAVLAALKMLGLYCVYVVIASAYRVVEGACTIINYGYGVFVMYTWETGTTMLGHLGYGIIEGCHGLVHCASTLIINGYVLIKGTCTDYVSQHSFSGSTLATGFTYVLFIYTCVLCNFGSVLIFSVCAPLEMTLFMKEEVEAAVNGLKQVAGYTEVWKMQDFLEDVLVDDVEGQAYQSCRNLKVEIDPEAPKVKLYTELKDEQIPGSKLTGQVMARLISFLKQHGHYTAVQTQDLGNCMYAAILRGTQMKREVASMLLRRFIVKKITQFPAFFSKYLRRSLAHTYGHERRDPAEVDRLEKEGKISADGAADERLPGPFSLASTSSRTELGEISMSWPSSPACGRSGSLSSMLRTSLKPGLGMTYLCPKQICFSSSLEAITSWELVSIFYIYRLFICDHGMIISACGVIKNAHTAIQV